MGFNTTVVICNDDLGHIEEDPNFGKELASAIRQSWGERSRTFRGGYLTVIEQHHADGLVVVAVGGNTGRVLGYGGSYETDNDIAIIRELADQLGYNLVRKRKKKPGAKKRPKRKENS